MKTEILNRILDAEAHNFIVHKYGKADDDLKHCFKVGYSLSSMKNYSEKDLIDFGKLVALNCNPKISESKAKRTSKFLFKLFLPTRN